MKLFLIFFVLSGVLGGTLEKKLEKKALKQKLKRGKIPRNKVAKVRGRKLIFLEKSKTFSYPDISSFWF